jgi:hypothetical protein
LRGVDLNHRPLGYEEKSTATRRGESRFALPMDISPELHTYAANAPFATCSCTGSLAQWITGLGSCAVKRAIRFEPVCANMGFFDTNAQFFRAGPKEASD